MKRKWLAVGIILLLIGICIIPVTAQEQSSGSIQFKLDFPSQGLYYYILKLTTLGNHPPDKPKVTGPYIAKPHIPYECKIRAIDSDGDNVSYQVDWSDGVISEWTGWYPAGEEITQSHNYSKKGHVSIKARAKDIHGAIGEWGHITFGISKSKQIISLPFFQFLERFPNAFPILRYLLEFHQ